MNTDRVGSGAGDLCETTAERLFRAGEYVVPGEYSEVESNRRFTLASPGFLPGSLDGHIAYYKAVRCDWGKAGEITLNQRQDQFQKLVARVGKRLYYFIYRTMPNSQDAEDVTQETLARAWRHFETFDLRHPFEAWVFQIAKNLMIDQNRRKRLRQEIPLDTPAMGVDGVESIIPEIADTAGDPESCLMAKQISVELQSAVGSLSPVYRVPFMLRAEDCSYEQIARELNCPVGTVRSRIHRARLFLRGSLTEGTFNE